MNLFIIGMPTYYGGAGSELFHQIALWRTSFPEIKLFVIPTHPGFEQEPLYEQLLGWGITVMNPMDLSAIAPDDAVINFCSDVFLKRLPEIHEKTPKIAWVNCMTGLFDLEKDQAHEGYIKCYLYQREAVRSHHEITLTFKYGAPKGTHFLCFKPYYHPDKIIFDFKTDEKTHIGRISRQDADKFSASTLHIYEYITSPKLKEGHFLGFDERSRRKIGRPFSWINLYFDQRALPVHEFYRKIDFIVQPMDTLENLPRIGFEAMHAGKPLVVDWRGGWEELIEHKVTGFLCNTPQEFIYWGTRLAFEDDLREFIAYNAYEKIKERCSVETSAASWKIVFEKLFN